MLFFSNEEDQKLKKMCREAPEIEFKYVSGAVAVASKLIRVDRDFIVIRGIQGELREVNLDVRSIFWGWTFTTKVLKRGFTPNGDLHFYCQKPKKIHDPNKGRANRFLVYPKAQLKVAVTTNQGNRTALFKLWDVSQFGCSLVNTSHTIFRRGTSLFQGELTLGEGEPLYVNLEVINTRNMLLRGDEVEILGCKLNADREAIQEIMQRCKRVGHATGSPI